METTNAGKYDSTTMNRRQAGAALLFFTSAAMMSFVALSALVDGAETSVPASYSVFVLLGSALVALSAIVLGVGVLLGKLGTSDESMSTTGIVVLLVLVVLGFGIGVALVIL